jgi:hypothetical protein
MKIQLTLEKLYEIFTKGYTMDQILILKAIDEGFQINMEDAKIATLHQSLVRKGLLFETENKLTTIGKELLIFVDSKDRKRIVKPKVESTEFDLWWEAYPRTDTFEYRGKSFTGSRSFRVDKANCRTKFNKIMLEGEYSVRQMVDALNLEVFQKKEKSFKEGSNKMAYMQNSLTYLNQRTFEGFIELCNAGMKITETKTAGETYI